MFKIMKSGFYYTNPKRGKTIKPLSQLFKYNFTIKLPKMAIIIMVFFPMISYYFLIDRSLTVKSSWLMTVAWPWPDQAMARPWGWVQGPRVPSPGCSNRVPISLKFKKWIFHKYQECMQAKKFKTMIFHKYQKCTLT